MGAGEGNYDIIVLANAKTVKFLDSTSEEEKEEDKLISYQKRGVDFLACENALKERNIDPASLFACVSIVPSGVMEIIKKQNEGFAYIKPWLILNNISK